MSDRDRIYERVARHYNDTGFEFESARLSQHFPIEFAITSRYLNRWISDNATVADIGVGVGHYAELLASRGCCIYLVDISQRLLDATYTRLKAIGLHERILGMHCTSATQLDCLNVEFDAVLLLGPLYHLCSIEERQQPVKAAAKILKPEGLLFAAGINRLTYFRELFRTAPELVLTRKDFHQQLLQDGNIDPTHAPPLGYGHLTTSEEFHQLFKSDFQTVTLTGVESFASPWQNSFNNLAPAAAEAWLDLIETTGTTAEGLGMTDHFLYVGRKKAENS
ncbi:class I SAM-dependent methyltransferase [Chroococcidiopsis thermalis]|uniref:Methyltransferase type 11 n=1 Tax=Chroococcidiopsis thermalis (strain PCC 7203) TaxID=251229 RepID=K9U7G3_CHRTP|nr:class I SAM-dependent methyltransferase [Chroococcidiopsis thermalis]AFY90361.1 Methyltransferase type 11 [Chroococcidiopsis thermalis PCC 7203]